MKTITTTLACVLAVLFCSLAQAQTPANRFDVDIISISTIGGSNAVTVCDPSADPNFTNNKFFISVCNQTSIDRGNIFVTIDLPPGVTFNDLAPAQCCGVTVIDPVTPVLFIPAVGAMSCVPINLDVHVDCSVIDYVQNGNPLLNSIRLDYAIQGAPGSPFFEEFDFLDSYNALIPDLVITDITNQAFTGNVGEKYARIIEVTNGGNGSLADFTFAAEWDNGVSVSDLYLDPTGTGAAVVGPNSASFLVTEFASSAHPSNNGDDFFDPGESVWIIDSVSITPLCDSAGTRYHAFYGCLGDTCFQTDDMNYAYTLVAEGGPEMQVASSLDVMTTYCSGVPGVATYTYTNNGVDEDPGGGRAIDIEVWIQSTTAVSSLNTFFLNGVTDLTTLVGSGLGLSTSIVGPTSAETRYTIDFSTLTIDPDGPGVGIEDLDGDGFYDDMLIGESFSIETHYSMMCPTEFAIECPTEFYHEIIRTFVIVSDQCMHRDLPVPGTNFRVEGDPCIGVDIPGSSAMMSGPTDLSDGETGTYSFEQSYVLQGSQYLACTFDDIIMEITIPTGFVPVPGSAMVHNPPSAAGTPVSFTTSGSVVIINTGTWSSITGGGDDHNLNRKVSIDLTLDCGMGGTSGPQAISFEQYHRCDGTCNSSCRLRMGCDTIGVQASCPPFTSDCILTNSFNVERTSFGWTDRLRTTKVTAATPGVVLDRAYECDTVCATVIGTVTGVSVDNAQVEIKYGAPSTVQILNPAGAFFEITDVSAGVTVTCPATPAVVTSIGSDFFLKYDATPCIVDSFGGMLDPGDMIVLKATYDVNKTNTLPLGAFELEFFRAQYQNHDGVSLVFCEGKGTRFNVLRTDVIKFGRNRNVLTCDSTAGTVARDMEFRVRGGICGEDFPNEFRNIYRVGNDIVADLPAGYVYVPGSSTWFSENPTYSTSTTIADPVVDMGAGTLTWSATDNGFPFDEWPLKDKIGHTTSLLRYRIEPTCEAPPGLSFDKTTMNWYDHDYAPDLSCIEFNEDDMTASRWVRNYKPMMNADAFLPEINSSSATVQWTVRLCNDWYAHRRRAENGWLAFENPGGALTLVSAVDTTDGAMINLPIVNTPDGNILVNAGIVNANRCRNILITANTTNCNAESVDTLCVFAGYSCAALAELDTSACIQDTLKLIVHPQEANLLAIANSPVNNTFNLCEEITYELEIKSSRKARMFDILADVELPVGMTLVSGTSMLQYTASDPYVVIGDPSSTGPNMFEYDLNTIPAAGLIATNGLPGVFEPDSNIVRIKFNVITDCNYVNGSTLGFDVSGNTNCGNQIIFSFQSDPQFIQGVNEPYTTDIEVIGDTLVNCTDSALVNVQIVNFGAGDATEMDSVCVLIPAGFTYCTGSFVGITNPPNTSVPVQSTVGTQTQLKWPLAELTVGDTMAFDIQVKAAADAPCGSNEVTIRTVTSESALCVATGEFCNIAAITGSTTTNIEIIKPDITISNLVANSNCMSMTIDYDLSNSGSDVAAGAPITVDFYCDLDMSGDLSAGDVLIGSEATTVGIPNGSSVSVSATFATTCQNDVIAVIDNTINCVCSGSEEVVSPTFNCCDDNYVTVTGTDVSCFGGDNGSATANTTAGTPPYMFMWSDGQLTQTAANLAPGTYTVTVKDANNCIETDTVIIGEPTAIVLSTTTVDVSCNGDATGSATVSATGGTPPYTFLWDDPAMQATATATGLTAGSYTVTVTDANGCDETANVTITEPSALVLATSQVNVLCNGDATGSATVIPSGGTAPYTFLWDDPSMQVTAIATSLVAGSYNVTVTDANGCTEMANVVITQPSAIVLTTSTTDVICFGEDNGTATVNPGGGTPPYTYLWNNGDNTQTITDLLAGPYSVTVTDANGCTETANVTVSQPTLINAAMSSTPVSCNGGNDGTATVTATGGVGGYTYLWNTGDVTPTITNLIAGTYTVTVTDANGCTQADFVQVAEPTAIVLGTSVTDVLCNGEATGSATVTPSGGTPPYTFQWNDPAMQMTATATGLEAGNYTVTVTDANGCDETANVVISEPTALVLSCAVTTASSPGAMDGSVTILPSGGTPGYSYLWSTGDVTQTVTGLGVGVYTVTVTDANGCTETHDCEVFVCEGFRTQTQGGWGTKANGNNPGVYRDANFAAAFPSGLTIGCTNTLTLTSSGAVQDFLPSGSTPSALPAGALVDPSNSYNNVFAGQLVALTLSVGFDDYDPSFGSAPFPLGDLVITSGAFAGFTVNDVLAEANNAIGGCGSVYSFSQLNDVLSSINQNFVDGTTDNGFLACPDTVSQRSLVFEVIDQLKEAKVENADLIAYPNPFSDISTIEFGVPQDGIATLIVYDMSGKEIAILYNTTAEAGQIYRVEFDAGKLESGIYSCRLVTATEIKYTKLILTK